MLNALAVNAPAFGHNSPMTGKDWMIVLVIILLVLVVTNVGGKKSATSK